MEKLEKYSAEVQAQIKEAQKDEVTEYHIYKALARMVKDQGNRGVLNEIANEELEHYRFWMKYSDEVDPLWWKVNMYLMLSRILGLVFSLKLLERAELNASKRYLALSQVIPEVKKIADEESNHERKLLNMINDRRAKGFGTWIISINLVVISTIAASTGWLTFSENPLQAGFAGAIAAASVALADFMNMLLLKSQAKVRSEQFSKALARLAGGIFSSSLIILPLLLIELPVVGAGVAMAVAVLILAGLNFYHVVISDYPWRQKLLRVMLALLVIVPLTAGLGFILRMIGGL